MWRPPGAWHAAIYYLEPPAYVVQQLADSGGGGGDPFFVSAAPSWQYLTWAGIWLILILLAALTSFERREL